VIKVDAHANIVKRVDACANLVIRFVNFSIIKDETKQKTGPNRNWKLVRLGSRIKPFGAAWTHTI
jgi:hypothetical protein